MKLFAPAKINLSLKVCGKREDGYHEVETIMAPVTLADAIELRCAPEAAPGTVAFICNDPTLPTDENNLCLKAVHAFQKASGIRDALTLSLLKQIPHGAGLGGGSSDAAATLRGMNELFNDPFTFEELHQLATSIGSDVPFFLDPKPRWCRGRGELLGETISLPDWKLILMKPPFPISAAEAYGRFAAGDWRLKENPTMIDGVEVFNDLEAPVFEKYLQLPILKRWLQEHHEIAAAWMTGSGSTMVAAFEKDISSEKISSLQKKIATKFGNSFWIRETVFAS